MNLKISLTSAEPFSSVKQYHQRWCQSDYPVNKGRLILIDKWNYDPGRFRGLYLQGTK